MSAVDALADSVAATTLTDKPDTNGATPSTQAADAAAASADEGRRLYIGNLAYATTEEELKEFFKTYTIETTSIPVNPRTNRPVGYAFVDIATAAEAAAAIQALSGKEILQRKVSVQLARKPEPAEAKEGAASGGEGSEGRKRAGGRGRGRGRARGRGGRTGRSRAAQDGQEATAEAVAETPLAETTNDKDTASKTSETRAARPQKQRGPPEDGIPSKTKVMVANLPYDLTEDKLKEIFAAYEPVSAKVALRPIPRFMIKKLQARNERRKTRGFGFVNLASQELQAKAVSEMNGKDIDGRVIAVKVAIDSPGKEDEDINAVAETEETAAPAAAAPAPAQENAAPAVTTKA
jgi:RNA recognition motif-containing protein